jgi:putative DNA primase/helicase
MSTHEYLSATQSFDEAQERFQRGAASLLDPEPELVRLAALDPLQYDRERERAAERLGVRVATLDKEVAARQPEAPRDRQGRSITFANLEPAEAPVEGARLIEQIIDTLRRYVVLPAPSLLTVALWVLRAHAHDAFDINPRLALLSPEKRCGKTTLLELLEHLVPRPLATSNVTAATVFRVIELAKPTLLIDEIDSFFSDERNELRGVLNSGHRRAAAYVLRCVGDDQEPRAFSTWCPMILCGIGHLPGTLADRSIEIAMQRRAPGESVTKLRWTGARGEALRKILLTLHRACARWVQDHAGELRDVEPDAPGDLHDRAADNWHPLLAIADVMGDPIRERARQAALIISNCSIESDSLSVQLLRDVEALFASHDIDAFSSAELCERLAALEERPWGEWGKRAKPISPSHLARLLGPFGVGSRNLKQPDGSVLKGYLCNDFEDAFARYTPSVAENPLSKRYAATSRSSSGDQPLFQSATETPGSVSENGTIAAPAAQSSGVADRKPESGPQEANSEESWLEL